jgi:hypothetical protein
VAVVDLAGRSLDTVVPMARPAALLADPVRSRVYCSVPSEGRVFVLDAAGDSVIDSILVGGDAGALCLLPDSGLLCCATPSSNSIAVIDCAINRVVKIVPAGDGDVLFYNSRRNKLYCASSGYQGRVAVISCSTWTLDTTLTLQTGVRALDYDPVADRLYCLPSSGSWVSVIECRRDIVVSQVLAGEYPAAIAFASAQRRMYVANQYGSSLTVIKDTAHAGVEEDAGSGIEGRTPQVTVVSGVLVLAQAPSRKPQAASWLLDISGRKVLDLAPGPNDVRALPPGVYFVRVAQAQAQAQAQAVRKVVITR